MPERLDPSTYIALVRDALAEDVGPGDITTQATVPPEAQGRGVFVAKSPCTLCGIDVAAAVFRAVDPSVRVGFHRRDGDVCANGDEIGHVEGRAASLLTAERTALNFLQYLSGIATLTRTFVDAAAGRITVLDTRKTTPTFRLLAKYAVRCGGGSNHRVGLFDGVLIKDNHIRLAGSIAAAVHLARAAGRGLPIEVEAQTLEQVDEALAAGADVIMLDNLDDERTRTAIERIAGRARIEISGNMTLARVRTVASYGADFVSVGALTHSAPAADISLELTT